MKFALSVATFALFTSVFSLSAKAQTGTDPEQSWNSFNEARAQAEKAKEARETALELKQARTQRIREALQLVVAQTGEPASSFTYKCYRPSGRPPFCGGENSTSFDYYRMILLQSPDQICRYDAYGEYVNTEPAILGFFNSHNIEIRGSVTCYNRGRY